MKIELIVLLVASFSYCSYAEIKIICEERRSSIQCPVNHVINIQGALYGRIDMTTCPHSSMLSASCASTVSYSMIFAACHGQRSCNLLATNDIFGWVCSGTYKYIRVVYTCRSTANPVPQVKTACEGTTGTIDCGPGKRIVVLDGFFGRTNKLICRTNNVNLMRNINCRSTTAFTTMRSACHGKQSCNFSTSNNLYGQICRDTHKYAQLTYVCYNH